MVAAIARSGEFMSTTDAARRVLEEFVDSFERLELEAFIALFCEDASVFYPFAKLPKKVAGREQVKLHFNDIFESHRTGPGPVFLTIAPIDIDVAELESGALVTFHLQRESSLGRRTILLVERHEGLRILHLHAKNTDE